MDTARPNTELTPTERRLANLKEPWPKGVSGNPAGKPVGAVSVKTELSNLMQIILKGEHNPLSDENENMTVARKVALNLAVKAIADGDLLAINKIIEHLDGRPAQSINLGGQVDNPVVFSLADFIDSLDGKTKTVG